MRNRPWPAGAAVIILRRGRIGQEHDITIASGVNLTSARPPRFARPRCDCVMDAASHRQAMHSSGVDHCSVWCRAVGEVQLRCSSMVRQIVSESLTHPRRRSAGYLSVLERTLRR